MCMCVLLLLRTCDVRVIILILLMMSICKRMKQLFQKILQKRKEKKERKSNEGHTDEKGEKREGKSDHASAWDSRCVNRLCGRWADPSLSVDRWLRWSTRLKPIRRRRRVSLHHHGDSCRILFCLCLLRCSRFVLMSFSLSLLLFPFVAATLCDSNRNRKQQRKD